MTAIDALIAGIIIIAGRGINSIYLGPLFELFGNAKGGLGGAGAGCAIIIIRHQNLYIERGVITEIQRTIKAVSIAFPLSRVIAAGGLINRTDLGLAKHITAHQTNTAYLAAVIVQ